ncbi:MAG TPA: DNA mismatch endonuclease Vsr [Thermoanaerobaculia bacterium]
MADVHSPETRTRNMAAIRSRNTKPEIAVRRMLHAMGFRFRLRSRLPGRPDIILPRHRRIIFVHGCFWHLHSCRFGQVTPATRSDFWAQKRAANVARDKKVLQQLRQEGWRVLVIWECWLRKPDAVSARIRRFLREATSQRMR